MLTERDPPGRQVGGRHRSGAKRCFSAGWSWEPYWGQIDEAEARLAYVAVTRAHHQLDVGGLSWINEHPDGDQPHSRPTDTPV
ncbi:hypothetical protein BJF83_20735 [Nocardiopsis sp. CNR-923]|nr:hypothetical protein BJF83_20735 [Nocardiopsis sp. CNR-923]